MRVLVVYASQYGATRGIAEKIAETLEAKGLEVDLQSSDDSFNLAETYYDAFVIGSAIHAGSWLKSAVEFVDDYKSVLANRPVWLFSSGPIGEQAVSQPQPDPRQLDGFRRALRVQGHIVFGGAFDPSTADLARRNWLERTFARFIPAGDFRDWEAIESWAGAIAEELTSVVV